MSDTISQVWTGFLGHRPISMRIWQRLHQAIEAVHASSTRVQLAEEAICTLTDCGADEEKRDWAERYLCGMEQVDFRTYLARRAKRAQ